MNLKPQCLITGCELYATNDTTLARGDLHCVGDVLIFNAVLDSTGNTKWMYPMEAPDLAGRRVISVDMNFVFERRGVLVMDRSKVTFSPEAANYLLHARSH